MAFIDRAYEFVKETVAHGGSVMFVGTKKQGQEAIAEQATRVGMPYVNHRWLGGMLTNFQTVHKRLQRLKELEEINFDDVAGSGLTKKELLVLHREKVKLERTLGGIRDMAKIPSAMWVIDTNKESIAVDEAKKLGIPVVAILDSNCDPDDVDYPIPGNDDAIRSVALLTRVIADAVADGLVSRAGAAAGDAKPETVEPGAAEPLPEWERELLSGDAAAAVESAPAAEAPAAEVPAAEAPVAEAPASRTDRDTGRTGLTDRTYPDRRGKEPHGERLRRRRQAPPRGNGRRDDGQQEGTRRGRRRLRQGRRAAAHQGRQESGQAGRAHRRQRSRCFHRRRVDRAATARPTSWPRTTSSRTWVRRSRRRQLPAKSASSEQLAAATLADGQTVQQAIDALATVIGEKLVLGRVAVFDGATTVYLHKRASDLPPSVGVLVAYEGGDVDAARGAAMQVAAMRPQYLEP